MKYRWITLLLVILTVLPLAAACKKRDPLQENPGTETVTEPETDGWSDSLPKELDFGDKTVRILWRGLSGQFSDSRTGDVVDDAMYTRDAEVEKRLGIRIQNVGKDYTYDSRDQYVSYIIGSVMSGGEDSYDIVSGHYILMPALVSGGYLTDLSATPYLSPEKPWYASGLAEETTIDGKLYLVTGDISGTYISDIYCMYVNMALIRALNLEDPYTLVREKKWTLETFESMVKGAYHDRGGDGQKTRDDRFGLCVPSANHLSAWMPAAGIKLTEMNSNHYPVISCDSEKTVDLVTRVEKLVYDNEDTIFYNNDKGANYTTLAKDFLGGQYLFAQEKFASAKDLCAGRTDVLLLPMPMYNADQKGYYTSMGEQTNLSAIPKGMENGGCSAATIEALSAYSHAYVSTAYYEKQLKLQYSASSEMSQMFDLIRSGVQISFGSVYGYGFNYLSAWFKDCVSNRREWKTYLGEKQEPAERQLRKFFDDIIANANKY